MVRLSPARMRLAETRSKHTYVQGVPEKKCTKFTPHKFAATAHHRVMWFSAKCSDTLH